MAEIDHMRIKSIYGELYGIYEELPQTAAIISDIVSNDINRCIDELSQISRTDYSRFKLEKELLNHVPRYRSRTVRAKIRSLLERLETEYDLKDKLRPIQPTILINNQNANEIDIRINFTIETLIENAQSEEEKENLNVIAEEIKKPEADWGRLKIALKWILNYSRELSLKVLPIILDYYLKRGG